MVSYKKSFGSRWLVVDVGGYILAEGSGYIFAGGGWRWVLVDIFWLVLGGGIV